MKHFTFPINITLERETIEPGRTFSRPGVQKFIEELSRSFTRAVTECLEKGDGLPVAVTLVGEYTFHLQPEEPGRGPPNLN